MRTRSGIALRSVLACVRSAAQCRCVPVNSNVDMTPDQQQSLLRAIKDARAPVAAFSLGVAGFAHPTVRRLLVPGDGHTIVFTTAACPVIYTGPDNKINTVGHYELPLDPSLNYVTENPHSTFAFLGLAIRSALLHVGDEFSAVGYLDRSPELEFLRHVRNAVAHGNRFNITRPLKLPASFRTYSISEALHGRRLLRDREDEGYLHAGDALALLDQLQASIESHV